MTAHVSRPGPPGRLRTAVAAVVALVVAFVVAPAALGVSGAAADEDAPVDVRLVSVAPRVLTPGVDLRVTVELTSTATVEDAEVVLRLNRFRMTTRDEVAAWAQRSVSDDAGSRTVSETLEAPLAPGTPRTVTLTLPAAQVGLLDLPGLWGPRGLAVEVAAGGERLGLERSYVLWNPTDDAPPRVPVAVVLPFVGPATAPPRPRDGGTEDGTDDDDAGPGDAPATDAPSPTGSASAEAASVAVTAAKAADADLDALTAPDGRLRAMLEAVSVHPDVTIAVDPSLLPLAESGSASAQRFAQRLRAAVASHDAYALPWADPDVAAVQHADQGSLLQVAADRAVDGLDGGAPLLLWAADDVAPDESTLTAVAGTGAAAMVTAPREDEDAVGAVRPVVTGAGDVAAVVPDADLTRLVLDTSDGATPASAAQRALADLAIVARADTLPAGVVIATERRAAPDRERLAAVVDAVAGAPWARTVTLTELLPEASRVRPVRAAARAVDRAELDPPAVSALADARESARSFAEVLDDPAAFMAGVDDQVLAPLAVAWRARPAERTELVEQTVRQVRARTTGLSVVETSDLTVIATTSDLRLTVRNELAVPVQARLVVDPRKACLTVGAFETPLLEPGDTSVTVPLEAHANCDVLVEVQLLGPSGQDVAAPIAFSARVSPTIESVGTVVVGILLALGLALGIVRTVRRGQSARRGARTVSESTGPVTLPVLGGTPADETDLSPEAAGQDDEGRAGTPHDQGAPR